MPTTLEGYSSDTTNLGIARWREKIPQQQGDEWMTVRHEYMGFKHNMETKA